MNKKGNKGTYLSASLMDTSPDSTYPFFIKYINNPNTRWSVCIGVPYGTTLWQVGDSLEQNGAFKMNMSITKRDLFNDRLNNFQHNLHLIHTNVMPLIVKTWMKSLINMRVHLCGRSATRA